MFFTANNFYYVLMLICGSTDKSEFKGILFCLVLIELFLIISFIVLDLFFFYVFFESVLIPMFIIIGF
jgi:NADH:ubiquinone oxidoreductase subunit 4 (subunit M)